MPLARGLAAMFAKMARPAAMMGAARPALRAGLKVPMGLYKKVGRSRPVRRGLTAVDIGGSLALTTGFGIAQYRGMQKEKHEREAAFQKTLRGYNKRFDRVRRVGGPKRGQK